MPKSAYEELILSLLDQQELQIEYCSDDPYSFNPYSFRSSFYRFRATDIGRMMLGDLTFSMTLTSDPETLIETLHTYA